MSSVMERINAVCERNRKDYEALAKLTGKSIAEIEADITAPDPGEEASIDWGGPWGKSLHKLGGRIAAEFDGGNITLYDTRTYSTKRITAITSEEMRVLMSLYTDGCCPVCMAEIPLNDVICDDCLAQAQQAR